TNRFTFEIEHIHRITAQKHAETTNERRRQFFFAHSPPSRIKQHHIPDFRTPIPPPLEKFRPTKARLLFPNLNHPPRKLKQLILFLVPLPIEPTDLIVLAVGVIVAALRSTPLVPAV